jgi:ATP-dependent helicase/nuclease subunit B
VDVERAFGAEAPLKLALNDDHVVHLTGFIDRIDVEGDHVLVRDWKTGRSKPRRGDMVDPNLGVDLQVAIYGMVAQQLSKEWGVPRKVEVAYVYPERTSEPERAFRADFKVLATSAREWLGAGAALVSEGVFPRTPDSGDCRYCHFKPVCGEDAPERSRHLLEQSEGALGGFVRLRIPEEA